MINLGLILGTAGVAGALGILSTGYIKAPPDKAYLISGLRKEARVVTGKAAIKIPFLERVDKLSLKLMKIDVRTSEAVPTKEFINVLVDAVVTIKISSKPELLKKAAENFLNQSTDYVVDMVKEVLEGNIREIVGKMELSEMISDRQAFSTLVQENSVPDMENMGIEIVSFNVQNFSDRNHVIDDLGIDNTTKIKKNAAIVKAQSEKDIAVAESDSRQLANDARVKSEQEIAIKNNELELKKSELRKYQDTQKAVADSAYEIEKEEQRKTIESKKLEADIIQQEKTIQLREKQAAVQEQELFASINKKADAEKYAHQQEADIELYKRKKSAEAEKYEVEQRAEALKIQADAEIYQAQQRSKAIELEGLAKAKAIEAQGLAEAQGIDKKAEAMSKMGQASVLEMYFKALPDVVKNAAAPLANVDKITMYGEGNTSNMVKDIMVSTNQIMDGLTESTGINVKSMLAGFLGSKIATKDIEKQINVDKILETAQSLPLQQNIEE